jgi:hypothetical protein
VVADHSDQPPDRTSDPVPTTLINEKHLWGGIASLNAILALLLPTRSGKAVAILGTACALLALFNQRRSPDPRPTSFWSLSLFALPLLSFIRTPELAFWRLDGRVWLTIAWLAFLAVLECRDRRASASRAADSTSLRAVPTSVRLFLLWAFIFWLTVVLDLGAGRFMADVNRTGRRACSDDPMTSTIQIWESTPASEHLYLAWRQPKAFAEKAPYDNHVHPFLLSTYAWIAAVRAAARVPLYVATNTTAILFISIVVGVFAILLGRLGVLQRCHGGRALLVLFVAVGFLTTMWRFWNDQFQFTTDNAYPLVAALLALVYAYLMPPARPVASITAAVVYVALSPLQLPTLALAVGCLFGQTGTNWREILERNRLLIRMAAWCMAVGLLVIAVPRLLVMWKGYHSLASTFVFRSGLDGDRTYFTNLLQAAWSPCPLNCCGPRPIQNVIWPAFLPLVFLWDARGGVEATALGGYGRWLLFLLTPYLVLLIAFPQSVSIHSYLYDHFVIIPIVMTGALAVSSSAFQARLAGTRLLAFLLISGAVIMSNLVALAQAFARLH